MIGVIICLIIAGIVIVGLYLFTSGGIGGGSNV